MTDVVDKLEPEVRELINDIIREDQGKAKVSDGRTALPARISHAISAKRQADALERIAAALEREPIIGINTPHKMDLDARNPDCPNVARHIPGIVCDDCWPSAS